MLKLEKVYKKYDKQVIGKFDLEMNLDTTYALIGKSGVGKSTFVKLITGVVKADGGNITFENRNLTKKDFTYISQIGTLFNHLTIEDNILLTYKGEKEKIVQGLNELNLDEDFLQKYPFELSGGQRQRIDLLRVVLSNTKIVILDEALSALDTNTKDDMYEVLKSLRKNHGLLIIIITHDIDEALYLGDRIIVMDSGKVVFNDEAVNILKQNNHGINNLISPSRLQRLRKVYIDE